MGLCLSSLGSLGLSNQDSNPSQSSSQSSSSSLYCCCCIFILIFVFPSLIPSVATQNTIIKYRNKIIRKGGDIVSDLSDLTTTSSGSLS